MRFSLRWRRPEASPARATGDAGDIARDLARAARILAVRSQREATGLFAGGYLSAFRGGGIEFDESRPYAPGDDVRNLDWNAMARTGEPFVKHFREERDETIVLALDVSASMRFGTTGRSKAETAAHAAALVAAAAGRAGDRVGLLSFAETVRAEIQPSRGASHIWNVVQTAVAAARTCDGGTSLSAAAEAVRRQTRQRAVVLLFSDFRSWSDEVADRDDERSRAPLLENTGRHDLVCVVLHDPREEHLPRVGPVRIRDPEVPGRTMVLNSNSPRVRRRFRSAAAERAANLRRSLQATGADVLWMRTDRDPLQTLMRFFHDRSLRTHRRAGHSHGAGPRPAA